MKLVKPYIAIGLLLSCTLYAQANKNDTLSVEDSKTSMPSQSQMPVIYSDDLVEFENDQLHVNEAEYLEKVAALEYAIPMDYNEEVSRLIEYFAVNWQVKLKEVITLSEDYFPIYEEILDRYNLPLELKYLSVIESALQPAATSRSGAAGPWQFMPFTAKLYQLEINSFMDERRHIEKSTEAACQYFEQMYRLYGDWLLVMASYNCGPGNVNKAIRRSGGKRDFWSIYAYLPKETRTYVPSFIAMAYMMNYYKDYGISPAPPEIRMPDLLEVNCTGEEKLEAVCQILEIDSEELMSYNPHLKSERVPVGMDSYHIKLPHDLALCYVEKKDDIKTLSDEIKSEIQEEVYVVKRGDCLPVIARKYGCSVGELKSWNGLNTHIIHPGQKLKVYL